jgi:DUF3102 family protein
MPLSTETTNVVALYPPRKDAEEASLDEFLDGLAERVRNHCRSTTASIIAIGGVLAQARGRVEHGQFKTWVTDQCGFTIRTAQNYMRAYALASQVGEIVSHLNPAALYRLSAAKTSQDVITHVVHLLERGCIPTEEGIAALIAAYAHPKEQPEGSEKLEGDQPMVKLARDLYSRIGNQLALKLVGCRWLDLRMHLREVIEQSSLTAN